MPHFLILNPSFKSRPFAYCCSQNEHTKRVISSINVNQDRGRRAQGADEKGMSTHEIGVTRKVVAPGKSGGRVPQRSFFMKRPLPVKIPLYLASVARLTIPSKHFKKLLPNLMRFNK